MRARKGYLSQRHFKEISIKAYCEITKREFIFYPVVSIIMSSVQLSPSWSGYFVPHTTVTITFSNLLNDYPCFTDF